MARTRTRWATWRVHQIIGVPLDLVPFLSGLHPLDLQPLDDFPVLLTHWCEHGATRMSVIVCRDSIPASGIIWKAAKVSSLVGNKLVRQSSPESNSTTQSPLPRSPAESNRNS
ncbi:hypothetical protein QBC46DRAFT_96304 [Diplogelasinospora grovesii]|uniref:Uncharacterized protein n=1 Tax=Diplogelasinospora grovesii TaxID=303347 RepID=A0AAN6NID2_9PEZI|nr:hypothetical protein QBC46DRAFT_96304 [Diplogelasinospora grovesii]